MSGSISPWPVVKTGSSEHPTKTLQYLLRARGHSAVVDGVFGPQTEAAVEDFQASQGLTADGIVGPLTWTALVLKVKKGSQGDAVRGVQEEFQFRNLSGDPSKGPQVGGIFGPITDAAVRDLEQALSLDIPSVKVDGIVGPGAWQAFARSGRNGVKLPLRSPIRPAMRFKKSLVSNRVSFYRRNFVSASLNSAAFCTNATPRSAPGLLRYPRRILVERRRLVAASLTDTQRPGMRRASNQGSFTALYVFAPKRNRKMERSAPVSDLPARSQSR